jgi:hypothetical protein
METRPFHTRKDSEAPLLVVIKALVERRHGFSVTLECGAASSQCIGIALGALDRIGRLLRAGTGRSTATRCGEIAVGLFEGGPRLFLLESQTQSGMQRSNARIEECGTIFCAKLLAPPEVWTGRRLLGIGGRSRYEHQCGCAGSDYLEHCDLLQKN